MADLIGSEVLTIVNGQQELLKSPWDLSRIESAIGQLESVCTTSPDEQQLQRINLQFAPQRVLVTIPGLDDNKAKAIVARRQHAQKRESIGWLVTDGLMTLEQLRLVAPYMTTGGDVWSGSSIGTAATSPTFARVYFVIDATLPETRLVISRESMPFTLPLNERPMP
jgi:hypothetical protein